MLLNPKTQNKPNPKQLVVHQVRPRTLTTGIIRCQIFVFWRMMAYIKLQSVPVEPFTSLNPYSFDKIQVAKESPVFAMRFESAISADTARPTIQRLRFFK
jgi:hypothetical protein